MLGNPHVIRQSQPPFLYEIPTSILEISQRADIVSLLILDLRL
jgi:hypothetical protein